MRTNRTSALVSNRARFCIGFVTMLAAGASVALADVIELVGPPADIGASATEADQLQEQVAFLASLRSRMSQPAAPVMCWPSDLPEAMRQTVIDNNGGLPPAMLQRPDSERYWVDATVWTGDLSQGPSGRAQAARFTYSFPDDGVTWGLENASSVGPNVLNSVLTDVFGEGDIDEGREYFRQALASWRRYTSLTYFEVADNNSTMDESATRVSTRGDVRIGGRAFGTSTFLAYNAFPTGTFAGVGGSDMVMNTSFFRANEFMNSTSNFRYLRNTVAHEHGHGLGAIHSVPCTGTKLMEPSISTVFDVVTVDDRRGGQRNYGDRFAGNNSAANAKDFGDLTSPSVRSVIERDLSTNGSAGFNSTDQDWFKFTLSSAQNVVITATPTGGTYTAGEQSSNCSGSTASINAGSAGNLSVALFLSDGTSTQQPIVNAFGVGFAETLTANNLPAGTYYARIRDVGPNASANQTLQLYDLTVRVGTSKAPPKAVAGLNSKRVRANTNCFYMGDINSSANEASGFLTVFAWDLDGDGVFEVSNNAKPVIQYPSNGTYNVSLRITDNNMMRNVDTITTTVWGATTTVTACTPSSGERGTSVPITITGTNLKNVTAAHVSVSGSGVSISGTAVPNSLGTSVSGLSLVIAPGATIGPRNIVVTNSDGSGTGTSVFTVNTPTPPAAFTLVFPPDEDFDIPLAPTFTWGASAGTTSYTLSIADNSALASPIFTQSGIVGTSFAIPSGLLTQGTLYWWGVTATGPGGNTSSPSFQFTTVPPPQPGAFSLITPTTSEIDVELAPTFSWSASSDATSYTISIAGNSALTSPIFTQSGIGTTTFNLPSGVLMENTQYWWGISAVGPGGSTISTPASRDFTTVPPKSQCADTNGDSVVNGADLSVLLSNFGQPAKGPQEGDFNADGLCNAADLSVLLANFGVTCP